MGMVYLLSGEKVNSMHNQVSLERKGIALNLASVLAMSTSPVLDKMALQSLTPVLAVVIIYIYNFIFSLIVLRRKLGRAFLCKLLSQRWLLLMGVTNAVAFISLFNGLNLTDPVAVGFLRRFYVVFAIILGYLLLGERFTRLEGIVVLISILGAFIFVSNGTLPAPQSILGSALIILSSLLFAFANLLAKYHIDALSTWELMGVNSWIVLFFVAIYALLRPGSVTTVTANSVVLLGASSLLSSFLGLAFFYAGLRYVSYWKANVIRTIEPVIVLVYSLPFFPQAITWPRLVGGGLLVASLVALLLIRQHSEQ